MKFFALQCKFYLNIRCFQSIFYILVGFPFLVIFDPDTKTMIDPRSWVKKTVLNPFLLREQGKCSPEPEPELDAVGF